jgi:sortase A
MVDPALNMATSRTSRGSRGLLSAAMIGAGTSLLIAAMSHYGAGVAAQRQASTPRPRPGNSTRAKEGDPIARIQIPSINLDDAVFEGVSDAVLRKGPGHMPETAPPGLPTRYKNCVIAAHRDSFFRRLGQLRNGEDILLSVENRTDRYRVVDRLIVGPENMEVAGPTREPRLTLVTCYPFSWVGAAPYRLVVRAERIGTSARFQ